MIRALVNIDILGRRYLSRDNACREDEFIDKLIRGGVIRREVEIQARESSPEVQAKQEPPEATVRKRGRGNPNFRRKK